MKLSNFIAAYLAKFCKHTFVVQGGAALHLIDSVEAHSGIENIAMQHEQASAMAADAYAKSSGGIGATISTSGPGATNLLTGIACSYFDSAATVHITGNVASFRQSDDLGVRQYGFQETDIVTMATPICKFATRLNSPDEILSVLPKALQISLSGRKGPVLIDIPDDFQRVKLRDKDCNRVLSESIDFTELTKRRVTSKKQMEALASALKSSKRPLFVFGAGLTNKTLTDKYRQLATRFGIPYVITWPLKGISDSSDSLNVGSFGTHSYRGNNIIVQNADLIISIGSRLDTRATAKLDTFAREAKIVMLDIDNDEIAKFEALEFDIYLGLNTRVETFVDTLSGVLHKDLVSPEEQYSEWYKYIHAMKKSYNYVPEYSLSGVNPYLAVKQISDFQPAESIVCVDTGTCLPLSLVYGEEKEGQSYISSFNNTPMGYGLPAAIGAALQSPNKKCFCMVGDGGMQMNIQELATLAMLKLNVLIVVFNNFGHAMIKQTQDDWLDSNYCAASSKTGLPNLNFSEIAKAYQIKAKRISSNEQLQNTLLEFSKLNEPCLIELSIDEDFRYEPIIKYGNPLESMSPTDINEQIAKDMLIKPI